MKHARVRQLSYYLIWLLLSAAAFGQVATGNPNAQECGKLGLDVLQERVDSSGTTHQVVCWNRATGQLTLPTSPIGSTTSSNNWTASNSFVAGLDVASSYVGIKSLQNDGTTGTALNNLVCRTAAGAAIKCSAGTTTGVIGVCVANCGTGASPNPTIAVLGTVNLQLDGAGTTNHFVTPSAGTAGNGTDNASFPTNNIEVLGTIGNSANCVANLCPVTINIPGDVAGSNAGGALPTMNSGTQGKALSNNASVAAWSGLPLDATQFAGADACAKIAAACTQAGSTENVAANFTSSQACSVANTNAMLSSCSGGNLTLGPFTLYVPLSPTNAATSTTPPTASIIVPNKYSLYGSGRGDAGTIGTTIAACTGLNTPVSGCTAPATRHFAITSTSVTNVGGRTYLNITSSGMNLVAGEPVRIEGSATKSNNGAWRVCSTSNSNSTITDANCPANPTATTVSVVGVSGVTAATASGGTGYPASQFVTGTGGGCTTEPTATVTSSAGVLNGITIINPGAACTTAPTMTPATGTGGTVTLTIQAACAASCGNLHGELPLVELAPIGNNTFGEAVQNMGIDCSGVVDCIPLRSLTGNEQSRFRDLNLRGSPERQLDIHSFNAQNMGAIDGVSMNTGGSVTCTVGTEGFFIGDGGPHGIKDFTTDESGCGATVLNWGGRFSANSAAAYIFGGHGEDTQFSVMFGQDVPTWGIMAMAMGGAPSGTCGATNCLPTDGAYQNQQSAALKVSNNYPGGTPTTSDYCFINTKKNTGSILTVSDDVQGVYITDNVTMFHCVDKSGAFYSLISSSPNQQNHFPGGIGTGRTANTDLAGSLALTGGTASYTFQNGPNNSVYNTAPLCWCNNTNQASVTACSASATTSTLTVKSGAGTDTVTYACFSKNF